MQTLTIGADSLETALGYLDCLRGFRSELVETADGRHQVKVTMYGDMDIYSVLDAIERRVADGFVAQRSEERLGLDGALVSEPAGRD